MPECYRCGRVLASAELRRSSRGRLCKDNARGSRCWTLTRERRQQEREAARLAQLTFDADRRAAV